MPGRKVKKTSSGDSRNLIDIGRNKGSKTLMYRLSNKERQALDDYQSGKKKKPKKKPAKRSKK